MRRGGFVVVLLVAATIFPANASSARDVPEMRDFALDLYDRLRDEKGNLVLSPLSVSAALVPLADGARGETRREIEKALRLPGTWEDSRARWLGALAAVKERNSVGVDIEVANGLWVARDQDLLPAFLLGLRLGLDVRVEEADFRQDSPGAVERINRFVSEATRGKIPRLVSYLEPKTRMMIVNAVYFKALWDHPFPPERTETLPFEDVSGASTPRAFLRDRAALRYYEDGEVQALELPYRGHALRMLLLLPRATNGLPAVERSLDRRRFDGIVSGLATAEVDVSIPRFKVESSFEDSFVRALTSLGVHLAFTDYADFSGMTGGRDLRVSRGVHKALVEVDEKGTEGAAATGIQVVPVSPRPTARFRADHPFLFAIRDDPTGAILFLGRVESP